MVWDKGHSHQPWADGTHITLLPCGPLQAQLCPQTQDFKTWLCGDRAFEKVIEVK